MTPRLPTVLEPSDAGAAGHATASAPVSRSQKSSLNPERSADFDLIILAAALALAGWMALRPLAIEWSVNAQYSYGWTVPFLVVLLLGRQWSRRPPAAPPAVGSAARRTALVAAGGLLFSQLPLRWLQEANPDWRPLGWVVTSAFIAWALLAVYVVGGRPWVRCFVFPFLFILVAVPWPERFEIAFVQQLMRLVTAAVIELLDWLGIPALQQGNLIQVASGMIGVEEACSGIRSLQSTLMISLFVGEFYSLRPARRVLLVVIGILIAFLTNLGRALFLVLITIHQGKEAFTRWHDTAGFCVMVACLLSLWGAALLLTGKGGTLASTTLTEGKAEAHASLASARTGIKYFPRFLLVTIALWPMAVTAAVESWYRLHERAGASGNPITFSVRWPRAAAGYQEIEIPETSRALLRYTESQSGAWQELGREQWSLFFARWKPGQSAAPAAKMHTPRVCLSAAGRPLLRDLGVSLVECAGLQLPIHGYVFDAGGRELYVFYCLWEDRRSLSSDGSPFNSSATESTQSSDRLGDDDLTATGRLNAALAGRRNLGQRVIELSLMGPPDVVAARERMLARLPNLIQRP